MPDMGRVVAYGFFNEDNSESITDSLVYFSKYTAALFCLSFFVTFCVDKVFFIGMESRLENAPTRG